MNRTVDELDDPDQRFRVLGAVWDRWSLPGGAAITAPLFGARIAAWETKIGALRQEGMATRTAIEQGPGLAAVGATLLARGCAGGR